MTRHTTAAVLVASGFAVCVPGAGAQGQCIPYQLDKRLEAYVAQVPFEWTDADALITHTQHLTPDDDATKYRLLASAWTDINGVGGCSDRDYHGQPSALATGSGVLARRGDSDDSDLIFTAGHVLRHFQTHAQECNDAPGSVAVIFGFGNFSPDQWQLTCEPGTLNCWILVNKDDVYYCVQQWDGCNTTSCPFDTDWGVGRLDRSVKGRIPMPIKRNPLPLPGPDVTIVGHPNSIPMKVEQVQLPSPGPTGDYNATGHVLLHSSGSMVIDDVAGEVIGTVIAGNHQIDFACDPPPDADACYREDFAGPNGALAVPSYLAAPYIP